MKIAINMTWGGFSVSTEVLKTCGVRYDHEVERTHPAVVAYASSAEGEAEGLGVVEIPDNATDHTIINYDGMETVLYVIDGKIHSI